MKKALYIFSRLDESDVEWIRDNGLRRKLGDGETLIVAGEPVSGLFFVLDGFLRVVIEGLGEVARLGVGEMVGEISFVDQTLPIATVSAVESCHVLELDREELLEKLEEDDRFAAHFYKAVATFLASRLKSSQGKRAGQTWKGMAPEAFPADELDEEMLDGLSMAGKRFLQLLNSRHA